MDLRSCKQQIQDLEDTLTVIVNGLVLPLWDELEKLQKEMGLPATNGSPHVPPSLREATRRYIMEQLRRNGGNKTKTARELQIDTHTLNRYVRLFGSAGSAKLSVGVPPICEAVGLRPNCEGDGVNHESRR